jgi:ketosteroid isomerase-like protein
MVASVLMVLLMMTAPQSASAASAAGSVEQAVAQMEKEWTEAGLHRDTAAVERIVADDWAGINWDGAKYTKAQLLDDLKSGTFVAQSVTMDPVKVRVFGDTAVATGGDTEKSTYKGKDSSGHYLWTDVYTKRNGKWQAVASQSTRFEAGKP